MLSFYFEEVYLEMGKEATATFIGHKECYGVQAEDVQREVEKLIASGVTDFLNGGMGGFDWMCARVVFDLKKSYPQIRNYLVIPYLTFNIASQNTSMTLSIQKALRSIILRLRSQQGTGISLITLHTPCAM